MNNAGMPPPMMGPDGPMGPPGGPMGPQDPMGMGGMNGPCDPMMNNGMGPPGGMGPPPPMGMNGPMDPMMGPPPMGMDPMGNPMDPMMDPMMGPDYIESSEYLGPGPPTLRSTGHDAEHSRPSQVSRQSSSTSMELDTVSVKKIEDREDEYSKVKQALLSDLNDFEEDLSPSPFDPNESQLPTADPLTQSQRSSRSDSKFEAIFGGQQCINDGTTTTKTMPTIGSTFESRSSTISTTSVDHSRSSVLLDAQHESPLLMNSAVAKVEDFVSADFVSAEGFKKHNNNNNSTNKTLITTTTKNHPNKHVEEPFPVCLSPDLDSAPLGTSGYRKSFSAIPEVPEEEQGSPTTGDGVSKAIKRGKPADHLFYLGALCAFGIPN